MDSQRILTSGFTNSQGWIRPQQADPVMQVISCCREVAHYQEAGIRKEGGTQT